MNNTKCAKCGLVSWADAVECKRCGASLLYDLNERSTVSNRRDYVSVILMAPALGGIAFSRYLGPFGYPLAILALLAGLGYAMWRVRGFRQIPQIDTKKGILTALIGNAVLLLVLGVAVPVAFFSSGIMSIGLPARPATWQDYMSPSGRYSIQLPGNPQEKIRSGHSGIPVNTITADLGQNGIYTAAHCNYSGATQVLSDAELLDRMVRQMLEKERSELLNQTPISIDSVNGLPGATGIEVETRLDEQTFGKGNVAIARLYWVKEWSNFYMVMATTHGSRENASFATKFLDSFRLVTQSDLEDRFSYTSANSPLVDAAADGNLYKLKRLLNEGVSQQDKDLALLRAVYDDKLGAVEQLIEGGANPNARDLQGQTPLMIAVVRADSCVSALIKARADVDAHDTQRAWTPIMFSLIEGQGISAEQLIAARAGLNWRDENWKTPLMYAVSNPNYQSLVPRMIQAHADVNAKTKNGRSVLSFAKSLDAGSPERAANVEALIRAGAKE